MEPIYIYTDGACRGNPGPGGWAALLIYKGHEKILHGNAADTTNNRMELTAAIQALAAIKLNKKPAQKRIIHLMSDSLYLKNGIEQWLAGWKQNNWRNAQKKAVKNKDLWIELDRLSARFAIRWQWVKGHSGHPENERVDQIARASISASILE